MTEPEPTPERPPPAADARRDLKRQVVLGVVSGAVLITGFVVAMILLLEFGFWLVRLAGSQLN